MIELQNPQKLHDIFIALPKKIKDWIASDQVSYIIEEISNRLALNKEKNIIIPKMIFRLLVQDLEPVDFINTLSQELNIDFSIAKTIAEDIEKKVFRPMEKDLQREIGLDLKLIYFGKPGSDTSRVEPAAGKPTVMPPEAGRPLTGLTEWEKFKKPTPAAPEPIEKVSKTVVDLQSFQIKGVGKTAEAPSPTPSPAAPSSPFMLHQENQVVAPIPGQKSSSLEPVLNVQVRNYSQFSDQPKNPPSKPVTAKIELPRVVHYNGNRTPINNLGMTKSIPENNRVDLRRFIK